MEKRPIDWGVELSDTMLRRYPDVNDLPPYPQGHVATFNYLQGVFLVGLSRIWEITRDDRYLQYIGQWIRAVQNEQGRIREYTGWMSMETLDFHQPTNVLEFMFELNRDPHLMDLISYMMEDLLQYPKNAFGGFDHFYSTPGQMWADGLYMVGPALVKYASYTGKEEFREIAVDQIFLMYEHLRDPESGLLRHGWDCTGKASWADPQNGRSPEVWGRACGWFVLAIGEMLDYLPEDYPRRKAIMDIQRETLNSVMKAQSPEGRWYEVVDKWDHPDNWPENSCTCLFVHSIAKGVRTGILPRNAYAFAEKAYHRVIETLLPSAEGEVSIGNICIGTGIEEGTYDYYIHRKCTENDLHGVGAFLLMVSEMHKTEMWMRSNPSPAE